jgi:ATP-grasp domain, R2K clade family 2
MILITQPRVGTSHNEILALQIAAREKGWEVLSAPSGWRLDEELTKSGKKGVPYGSQIFCEVIAQQMGWTLKQNSFDWLAKVHPYYLKRKVEFMTLDQAKLIKETKFIKPADDKVFPAKVYAPGELITHETIQGDTPTLVSDVVEWDLEYRTFVDKRVRTWSNYMFFEHVADPKMWNMVPMEEERLPHDFVNDVLHDMEFHDMGGLITVPSVIDVGRIKGKGWAIIETNPAWASGLYGCDALQALKVMEQSCE